MRKKISQRVKDSRKKKANELYEKTRLKIKGKTRSKQREIWKEYREKKYSILHPTSIAGITLFKRSNKQSYYKTSKRVDLKQAINKLFDEKKLRYVIVILKIRTSNGEVLLVSDVFSKAGYERILEIYKKSSNPVMDAVLDKLQNQHSYEGFEVLDVFLRTHYESSKTVKTKVKN